MCTSARTLCPRHYRHLKPPPRPSPPPFKKKPRLEKKQQKKQFHNEAILLVHFSPRYKRSEILAALDANLPPALRAKCVPFLNGFA